MGWVGGAGTKTLHTAALSLVYCTAEYCAPVWWYSMHNYLIENVLNDILHIVSGYLHSSLIDHLSILSGIEPPDLCRLGATLALAKHRTLDSDHILYSQLAGSPGVLQERLLSRCPFVSAAWKLLDDLFELGICLAQWTKYR